MRPTTGCASVFRLPCKSQRATIFKRREKKPKTMIRALRDDPTVQHMFSDAVELHLTKNIGNNNSPDLEELETSLSKAIPTAAKKVLPNEIDDG